ncbi:serine hydrolase [Patescibacteria group bacterium AH-259-L05]|nr:serine hydrolase [Patescibacteria group bacterium AH-259-L05]
MISFILSMLLILTSSPVLNQTIFLHNSIEQDIRKEITFPYSLGPKLTAQSALVVDLESDIELFSKNSHAVLPIASITKLMTALVFLENKTKLWDDIITVEQNDLIIQKESPYTGRLEEKIQSTLEPAGLDIEVGDRLAVHDIFYGGLIKSANNAIKILTRLTYVDDGKTFVDLMNEKAHEFEMNNTHFVEPTGLSPKNYSTAQDLVKLIKEAMKRDEIKQAMSNKIYDVTIVGVDGKKRYQRVYSTNKLLGSFVNLVGAKTGYLDESGYCFTGLSEYNNRKLAVIILGAASDYDRFQEVKSLLWWTSSP